MVEREDVDAGCAGERQQPRSAASQDRIIRGTGVWQARVLMKDRGYGSTTGFEWERKIEIEMVGTRPYAR